MSQRSTSVTFTVVFTLLTGFCLADEIVVLPAEFELVGPEAQQHLLVLSNTNGIVGAEISDAKLYSSNESVIVIQDGIVIAKGNGTATVVAETSNGKAVAKVTVSDFEEEHQWSFSKHVLPVLSRKGCNAGACHGALAGKGGFRLSLRGYDPAADFYTMTREARGRRIEIADPARSLILIKPTTATRHRGGKRLDTRSRDYRVLAEWITNGAAGPRDDEAKLIELDVEPVLSELNVGDTTRLIVTARYSDGRTEDVSSWARFTSADESVAQVDENGNVKVIGSGQGAITAWFSSRVRIARIISPFPNNLPEAAFAKSPTRNFIDDLVLQQLQRLQLKPSRQTNDSEFVRRVHFDTIGVIPSVEESETFLADKDPDKRDRLIDSLLSRDEFVDYWSYRLSDIFLVNGKLLRPDAVKAYYGWIRSSVASNKPWDQFARELVTSRGSSLENGATNFYAVHQDPEQMAENVSQAFLSLSIGCAKCHNHPLEKWTNDQYYGFANLFARVRAKGWGGDARNGDGRRTLYIEPRGDLIQPRTGKPQPPAPLDGEMINQDSESDRREHLAAWLTSPDNPYFARSITNRIWAGFFGTGLVDPVDDLRVSNPASNEALLSALSQHLIENKFDLKKLMRTILISQAYQRSSEVLPENKDDRRYLSRYRPRRLMAEVLHDAIVNITGVPANFRKIVLKDGSTTDTKHYKEGTRAVELYDSAVQSYFLKTFGRNNREITCECERSNQPSMVQVLHLSNGDTLNEKLRSKDGPVAQLANSSKSDAELIEHAYMQCLSRKPTRQESRRFQNVFSEFKDDRQSVVEDLYWALMTSREFLFQH